MLLESLATLLIGVGPPTCAVPIPAARRPVFAVAALPDNGSHQDVGGTTAKNPAPNKQGTNEEAARSADAVWPDESRPVETPQAEPRDRFVWAPRPSLRLGNKLRMDLRALLQVDVHRSYDGAEYLAGLDLFELRRIRVGIEGNLFGRIDYQIERQLNDRNLANEDEVAGVPLTSRWRDVRADITFRTAALRVGRFKIPFGLDRLTNRRTLDFVYLSLGAEYLAPGRDTGVMLYGPLFGGGLNYWTGVFRQDGDNARSKSVRGGGTTYAARMTGTPLRRLARASLDQFVVGGAFTTSALSNDGLPPNGLRGQTVMTADTFFSPVYVDGRRRRLEADVDWMVGPASVRAEYTYVTDNRMAQGIGDEDLPNARYRSWYLSGTYLVTGETKARPLRPRDDVFRGGPGAIELAVRYERVWYDSVGGQSEPLRHPRAETIFPNGSRVLTVGVNWILNRWIKLRLNGIREHVTDPARNPAPDGRAFWSPVFRFQVAL